MLSAKARPELESLAARLQGWHAAVPPRARRFHSARTDLEARIRDSFSPWKPWISGEVVERFRDRVQRLGEIADELIELIHQAERIASEVRLIEQRAPQGADGDLGAWLHGRCRQWSITLEQLGASCERSADLHRDSSVLARTETEVRLHGEAVHQLQEAERTLAALGSNLQAATLAAELPQLCAQLYQAGASHEWLARLKALLQPLRTIVDRIQDPPPELRTVNAILREARGWSKLLGEQGERVEQLEERHRFFALDADASTARELAVQAEELRNELVRRAHETGQRKLTDLEEQKADLFQACGLQPDLEERLAPLRSLPLDSHQLFRDWLSQLDRVQELFQAIAQTHEGPLEKRLSGFVAGLGERLRELDARPLSDAARRQLESLMHDVRHLAQAQGAEEILRGLRHSSAIERQIEELAQQALEESREITRWQEDLTAQHAALQAEAGRVGLPLLDLAPRIAELSHGAEAGSLERSRVGARALAAELAELQERFLASCQERLASHARAAREVAEALRRTGAAPPDLVLPDLPADATPHAAAEAVAAAGRLHQTLLQRAKARGKELDARRAQAQAEIALLRPDDLAPTDRQTAAQLREEIQGGSWSQTRNLLERLRLLARLVEKADLFFERLHQEQRSAEQRRADLHRRLQQLTEDGLSHFCPELTERAAALVHGIPAQTRQWSSVHHQLDLASELLTRVETQARRLAAEELDLAVRELGHKLRGSADPSFRSQAQEALSHLEAWSLDEIPPVTLRLRVRGAAQRRG